MKYFYLALLIWFIKILLFISIIGIPLERYLSYNYSYFCYPFTEAEIILNRKR